MSLLFKYSILNKKLDQNTFIGPNFTSEKAYIEDIIKSVQQHDSKILGKIQKRRGRKKFILNQEDFTEDSSAPHLSCLNKREQKYF